MATKKLSKGKGKKAGTMKTGKAGALGGMKKAGHKKM